jgi:hypothetical protein
VSWRVYVLVTIPGSDCVQLTCHNTHILSILEDQRSIAVQLREKDASQVNNQLEQLSFKVLRPFLLVTVTYCLRTPDEVDMTIHHDR